MHSQLVADGDEGDEERHGERSAHLHRELALAFVGEGEVLKEPEAVSEHGDKWATREDGRGARPAPESCRGSALARATS